MVKKSSISIEYEDDFFLAVNKPAGLLTIDDRYDSELPSLFKKIKSSFDEIYLVHRLDKDTSGIILMAKTKDCQRGLSQLLMQREIKKTYHALIDGKIPKENMIIQKPIGKDPKKKGRMKISPNGKEAITKVDLLESFGPASLIKAELITGRTHQIRVHLASVGHPLFVDKLYGKRDAFYLSSLKSRKFNKNRSGIERPLLGRQSLHSHSLEFHHPMIPEKKIELKVELPKDIRATINQLRKLT